MSFATLGAQPYGLAVSDKTSVREPGFLFVKIFCWLTSEVQMTFLIRCWVNFIHFFSVKGAVFVKLFVVSPQVNFHTYFCIKINVLVILKFCLLCRLENTGTVLEWWFFFAFFIHVFFFLTGGTCPAAIFFCLKTWIAILPEGCARLSDSRRDVPGGARNPEGCARYMRTRRDVPGVEKSRGKCLVWATVACCRLNFLFFCGKWAFFSARLFLDFWLMADRTRCSVCAACRSKKEEQSGFLIKNFSFVRSPIVLFENLEVWSCLWVGS